MQTWLAKKLDIKLSCGQAYIEYKRQPSLKDLGLIAKLLDDDIRELTILTK